MVASHEERLKSLEARIMDAAQKYYTDGTSPLTDAEFDALVEELREEDPNSRLLETIGWGYDVSKDTTPGEKIKHKYGTAGSLEKAYSWEEIKDYLRYKPVDISLKLDGISCVLYYKEGKLQRALTRGDGVTGIDVTNKIRYILPPELADSTTFTGAVRGEILMRDSNWELFHKIHPEAKNSRNSTAGIINSNKLTSDINYLSLVVYTIVGYEASSSTTNFSFFNMSDIYDFLEKNFADVVPHVDFPLLQSDLILDFKQVQQSLNSLEYPVDGLVMKAERASIVNQEVVYTAQAFKFDAESAITEVDDIEWNLTKTHYLMPKIKVRTVSISGTNVSYCTGFNAKYILDNDIGFGTVLRISKHGEIIPCVDEVINATAAELPRTCPECGGPLNWEGVHLKCENPVCGNAILQDTMIWMKTLAPKDGVQDAVLLRFLDYLKDHKILNGYSIEEIMNQKPIYAIHWPSVMMEKCCEVLNTLLTGTFFLEDAIRALNIPRFGTVTCKQLAKKPDMVEDMLKMFNKGEVDQWTLLGVSNYLGKANTQALVDNAEKFKRLNLIVDRLIWEDEPSIGPSTKVAITGKLSVKRADFEKELAAHGFVAGEITKDTKYLITDDPTGSSSKNKKADQLGITKITESEFRNKFFK